jgi:hypothetical protein
MEGHNLDFGGEPKTIQEEIQELPTISVQSEPPAETKQHMIFSYNATSSYWSHSGPYNTPEEAYEHYKNYNSSDICPRLVSFSLPDLNVGGSREYLEKLSEKLKNTKDEIIEVEKVKSNVTSEKTKLEREVRDLRAEKEKLERKTSSY